MAKDNAWVLSAREGYLFARAWTALSLFVVAAELAKQCVVASNELTITKVLKIIRVFTKSTIPVN